MREKEKEIGEKMKDAIPKMSDVGKGYILGKTESLAADSHTKDKEDKED